MPVANLPKGQLLRARAPHPNAGMHAVVVADRDGSSGFQTVYWTEDVGPGASAFDPVAVDHADRWFEAVPEDEKRRLYPDGISVPEFFIFPAQTL